MSYLHEIKGDPIIHRDLEPSWVTLSISVVSVSYMCSYWQQTLSVFVLTLVKLYLQKHSAGWFRASESCRLWSKQACYC